MSGGGMWGGGSGDHFASMGRNRGPEFDRSGFEIEPQGRFSRGLSLALKSWQVIRADRSLVVLPLLQLVCQAAAAALVFGPIAYFAYRDSSHVLFIVGLAAIMFPVNFVATFFGVAFVAVVRAHLEARKMPMGEALRFAASRLDAITGWALLSTAVGVAIAALERLRGGAIAARIAGWLLNAAWTIATLFVIPALASERIGPIAAARQSAAVVKRKWAEGVVGSTAINIAFGLIMVPVVLVGAIGWMAFSSAPGLGVVLMAIGIGGFLFLGAMQSAVDGVFRLALYDYASSGAVHAPFTEADLATGLKPKRRWFGR